MDGEHLLPLGEGKVLDRMHDLDAGIGDEDADADRSFFVAKLLRGLRREIGFQVGDRDAAAGLDKTLGDAMTDAARGAGNESNLAVELHETRSLTLKMNVTALRHFAPPRAACQRCEATSLMVITLAPWDGFRDLG